MRRSLTLIKGISVRDRRIIWSTEARIYDSPLSKEWGRSRCRSQRWRARGMLMLPALLLVPENIRTTRNAEFVKMWKLWNFAHSTLPWPGERWRPSEGCQRSPGFRDANLGGVVLPLVELLGMAQMSVSRWGSLWRHMDRRASRWLRWIRWDMMRYDEIFHYLYLKTMQDVHGIIQFLWLLHLHRWCVHIHHCYLQMAAMTFLRGFVNDHVVIECLKGWNMMEGSWPFEHQSGLTMRTVLIVFM